MINLWKLSMIWSVYLIIHVYNYAQFVGIP